MALFAMIAGCSGFASVPLPPPHSAGDGHDIVVDARRPWTATDLDLEDGELFEVFATGIVGVERLSFRDRDGAIESSPDGTYDWPQGTAYKDYPLAAAGHGPVAPFGLIGRIGEDGEPFPLGRHRVVRANRPGRLWLGVNDFDHADNRGGFRAVARAVEGVPEGRGTMDTRGVLGGADARPRPVDDARVLVLFVDGLQVDALLEMAHAGYLPNFRRIFLDGGLDIGPTFTVAPSNTIVATTAGLTGSWPDRSGLFTQLVFDRQRGSITYLATPEGPARAVAQIGESWWEAPLRADDRPPLMKRRVERAGQVFRSTVIPVMPDYPPDRYVQRLANEMALLSAHKVKDTTFDRAQTAYAVDEVLERDARVMFVYYTGVDAATHRSPRGPWGEARRDMVRLDEDLGRLERELVRERMADRTYWVLYADHGSLGGRTFVPQSWDAADEFFYRSIVDADGDRRPDLEGGLGMNVLYHPDDVSLKRLHSDSPAADFAVCAAQAWDVAWAALPRGGYGSRDWTAPNSLAELRRYRVHEDFEEVDVVRGLLEATAARGNQLPGIAAEHPVAFVLVPEPPDAVWVLARESVARIERRRVEGAARRFEYRYRVVEPGEESGRQSGFRELRVPRLDPFGYLAEASMRAGGHATAAWLGAWHDDREWLEATAEAVYPDAVVSYAHALLDDPAQPRIDARARYDMLLVASPGWNFGQAGHEGSPDHGGPHRDEKRIPFFVAGPGLARGARIQRPSRIVDVLPTVLELAGIEYDPESMDGRAVRDVWADPATVRTIAPRAVTFAWDRGLGIPEPDSGFSGPRPAHDAKAWYDLHNLLSNFLSLSQQEVLRLADRLLDTALIPGPEARPIGSAVGAIGHAWSDLPDGWLERRPAELARALRLHTITVGELTSPVQSLQNIDRIAMTVDWVRAVLNDPFGKAWPEAFTPVTPLDIALSQVSSGLLGVRRVLFEWMARGSAAAIHWVERSADRTSHRAGGASRQTPRVAAPAKADAARSDDGAFAEKAGSSADPRPVAEAGRGGEGTPGSGSAQDQSR